MQVQQWRTEAPAMTFDEVSMERSKSFVQALQELKNLRPQLYSAAEYCEKSYLHNEQKQVVLDNLKDYAVRALVNAVDHLGTVAYKLTDLFEQQTSDISNVEQKISCFNQQIDTCQTYMNIEGLRQQRFVATSQRHHKHYVLPNAINKKVRINPLVTDAEQKHIVAKPRSHSQGTPASKTLSWHLASETNTALNETPNSLSSYDDDKATKSTPDVFSLRDAVEATTQSTPMPLSAHLRSTIGGARSHPALSASGTKDPSETQSSFNSFNKPGPGEVCRPGGRSKSVLSAFFAKNKFAKQKKAYAS